MKQGQALGMSLGPEVAMFFPTTFLMLIQYPHWGFEAAWTQP